MRIPWVTAVLEIAQGETPVIAGEGWVQIGRGEYHFKYAAEDGNKKGQIDLYINKSTQCLIDMMQVPFS